MPSISPEGVTLATIRARLGDELAVSEWVVVDQARIDAFAEATGDRQWIHTDPSRASASPFGTTIAHGFLTLSLLPALIRQAIPISGVRLAVNYGTNRVRFPSVVAAGAKVRARFTPTEATDVAADAVQVVWSIVAECEGSARPCAVVELITRYYVEPMSDFVHYTITDRVAVLTIDNPPVNALSDAVRSAIRDAVRRAIADDAVDAIVLTGKGATFVAGADIKAFDAIVDHAASLSRSAGIHDLFLELENSPKPLVAAIRGNALGGGLELAMACHYRVATTDAKLGQPEVLLGLIPGAGGTQRLPRLVGGELALRMCTDGKPITALDAASAGLIDLLAAGGLVPAAITFASRKAAEGAPRRTREIAVPAGAAPASAAAAHTLAASLQGKAGALAAANAARGVAGAFELPFADAAARERELFAECVLSTESRALRHLFFAERDAAKPAFLGKDVKPYEITRVAVIGAGTMGVGIAMCYASAGIPVVLKDVSDEAVQKGVASIRKNYEGSVAKGRITQAQCDKAISLVTATASDDAFADVDLVVEAAFEDMALKREIFATLGRLTKPECILASNTSTLDIDELAQASRRPSFVVGHHFFSPANIMKLLEIVRGQETSDRVIATSLAIGKRIGKICAVVGNCFGFVANRMLAYYMREAYLLLEEGATVEQIDRVVSSFGLPVGPFAMQDIAGIDVGTRIRQHLAKMGKTRADGPQSEVPDRLFDLGRYGQKTNAGWYRYEPGSRTPVPDPLINEVAAVAAAKRGITRRSSITDDEILARITTALANEGARVLDEGYASSAGDIDVIYCYGFGFPRYRGGPMFYAQTIGLDTMLARVRAYRSEFGDYWKPAPLLERLVASDGSLYDVPSATTTARG